MASTQTTAANEIWERIFLDLGYRDLKKCRQTCRLFRDVIDGSILVQYHVELDLNGLVDSTINQHGVNFTERLQLLRYRRDAWGTLDWKLCDRNLVNIVGKSDITRSDIAGNYWAGILGDQLVVLELPSKSRPGVQSLRRIPIDLRGDGFRMDPSQDLVVFGRVEGRGLVLDLRSLSTLGVYQGIPRPQFILPSYQSKERSFQILDDIIVSTEFVWPSRPNEDSIVRVSIFNWKLGRDLADRLHPNVDTTEVAFVHPRIYVISVSETWNTLGYLAVFSTATGQELVRLQYPVQNNKDVPPATVELGCARVLGGPCRGKPFMTPSEENIFMFCMKHSKPRLVWWRMVMKVKTLLAYIRPLAEGDPAPIIPWDEWAPDNVRLLEAEHPARRSLWQCHGSQILNVDSVDGPIRIYEFSVDGEADAVREPSVLDAGDWGKGVLRMGLPYALRTKEVPSSCLYPRNWLSAMYALCDDRIIIKQLKEPYGLGTEFKAISIYTLALV